MREYMKADPFSGVPSQADGPDLPRWLEDGIFRWPKIEHGVMRYRRAA